jgi:hypothetical protein
LEKAQSNGAIAAKRCLEHAASGRHRERRSCVAIQPFLAAATGLMAGLLTWGFSGQGLFLKVCFIPIPW